MTGCCDPRGCDQLFGARFARRMAGRSHPPAAMLAVLERHGLQVVFGHRGIPWQIAGLERSGIALDAAPRAP